MSTDVAATAADEDGSEVKIPDGSAITGDEEELAARVALLAEENERLRREYRRARQAQYRRTALALVGCGAVAALAGVLFPDARSTLFALAGTGLFAAILTYFLTPERIVPASVGKRTYAAYGALGATLRAQLGLTDETLYLPTGRGETEFESVLLFVPQHAEYELPDPTTLDAGFVVADDERGHGLAVRPTGTGLYPEFSSQVKGVAETPEDLAVQLADALVESFALSDSVTTEVGADGRSVTFGVSGSAFGSVERFDHPIPSFIAVGLARALDRPISVEQLAANGEDTEYLVRCSWEADASDERNEENSERDG
ncbi:hypothetical protein [Haladaptatus sp. AB643]|uniref:hypothetical protein n=1 Tax=Haladaptatus sp. AB643 TaxID=2934174 RepID=UPI00209C655F|nr:hypothetical protein [Haladaptatus sp. AB643]MCO8245571.1 hypothetical protein [Haladaptatus sp. AB643]